MEQIISKRKKDTGRADEKMKKNRFLKPAHCGSIRTDLPLTVIRRKNKRLIEGISAGQLFCVGKVYLKTHDDSIRIR